MGKVGILLAFFFRLLRFLGVCLGVFFTDTSIGATYLGISQTQQPTSVTPINN